jgi:hypothetical protein
VTDREKMEGSCSTGQSPQRVVVPVEEIGWLSVANWLSTVRGTNNVKFKTYFDGNAIKQSRFQDCEF